MFKKLFKISIILGFTLLLSGCGKKMTTEEVFTNSVVNFNNCPNYDASLNLDMSVNNNDASLISIIYKSEEQINKANKVGLINSNTTFSFLGFGDTINEQGYIDYSNNKKYTKAQDEEVFSFYEFKRSDDLSYTMSHFLQNGVIVNGEMTEYTNQDIIYYAIPCQVTFNTLKAFIEGMSLDESQKSSLQENLSKLTEEDLSKLSTLSVNVRYYVYKDSILPARIIVDKESLKSFLTALSECLNKEDSSTETTSESFVDISFDLSGISFNINTIEAIFTNYNIEETLEIPQDIISNAIEGQSDSGISLGEGFSINSSTELSTEETISEIPEIPEETIVEVTEDIEIFNEEMDETINIDEDIVEETEEIEESINEEFLEIDTTLNSESNLTEIFNNLGFYIDEEFYDFSLTCQDFIDKGFDIHEDLKEEVLNPGNYSIPVNHISKDGYFTVIYMNNSEEEKPLLECNILSIELDSLFFENISSVTKWKIPFNATLDVLIEELGSPSYKYSGELTYIYTYELDKTHYIEFQIDKETNIICYVKLFSANL